MRYERWAPLYEQIRAALGYGWAPEERSAKRLRELLDGRGDARAWERLDARLAGRDAVVVGLAPRSGPPPLWRLPPAPRSPALLAADGAARTLLDSGLVPDVVVTDLDGPVPSEIAAQSQGAAVVVHAHGDNLAALERWVPAFGEETLGTWAGAPQGGLRNPGGFTDGDRAAFVAAAAGARSILLWGFDLDRVGPEEPDPARKLAKLLWARKALGLLRTEPGVDLRWWDPDGSVRPVPEEPGGPGGA